MSFIFFIQEPVLTQAQFHRLANIFDNAGQGIFVVAVLSQMLTGVFDKINWVVVVLGLGGAVSCWFFSMWLAKKGESYGV